MDAMYSALLAGQLRAAFHLLQLACDHDGVWSRQACIECFVASDRTKNTSTIVSLFSRCPGVCSSHALSEAFGVAHSLVYRVVFLGPPEFQAFHVIFRSLLECERRHFHWRPQNKARCGGPLYVDYNEFPNYGGTSFEGCVSGSYIGPRFEVGPLAGPRESLRHGRQC